MKTIFFSHREHRYNIIVIIVIQLFETTRRCSSYLYDTYLYRFNVTFARWYTLLKYFVVCRLIIMSESYVLLACRKSVYFSLQIITTRLDKLLKYSKSLVDHNRHKITLTFLFFVIERS